MSHDLLLEKCYQVSSIADDKFHHPCPCDLYKNCTNRDWKSKYACCGSVEVIAQNTLPPEIPAASSIPPELQEGTQKPLDIPVKDIETIPHSTIFQESSTVTPASFKGSLQNNLSIRPSRHT